MKAYNYGPDTIIARDLQHARKILRSELGVTRFVGLKRSRPPFVLADTDHEPLEVSEKEFCERVQTYGDGMVYRA